MINSACVCCVFRGAVRVPAEEPQPTDRSEVVEEQTQYRGNRNPSTQSRSFRIITDSLVEEMNCESLQSSLSLLSWVRIDTSMCPETYVSTDRCVQTDVYPLSDSVVRSDQLLWELSVADQ